MKYINALAFRIKNTLFLALPLKARVKAKQLFFKTLLKTLWKSKEIHVFRNKNP